MIGMEQRAPTRGADELLFVPLGGLGEIGMNLALYGFGPKSQSQMADGRLRRDLRRAAARRRRYHRARSALSHRRFSAISSPASSPMRMRIISAPSPISGPAFNCPLYATPFAAGLLQARVLNEAGAPEIPIKIVAQGSRLSLGPFEVELIPVAHSIPESCALAIRTSLGLVLHTGDWKIDPEPGHRRQDRSAAPRRNRRRRRSRAHLRFDQYSARRHEPVGRRRCAHAA